MLGILRYLERYPYGVVRIYSLKEFPMPYLLYRRVKTPTTPQPNAELPFWRKWLYFFLWAFTCATLMAIGTFAFAKASIHQDVTTFLWITSQHGFAVHGKELTVEATSFEPFELKSETGEVINSTYQENSLVCEGQPCYYTPPQQIAAGRWNVHGGVKILMTSSDLMTIATDEWVSNTTIFIFLVALFWVVIYHLVVPK